MNRFQIQRQKALFNITIILIILFVNIHKMQGVEQKINQNLTGIWYMPNECESSTFTWKAQWIWLNEKSEQQTMLARKTFQVDQMPEKSILRITASDNYSLYVNGNYVIKGPARSASHHQSYDILDISKYIVKGNNVIAVKVDFIKGSKSYLENGRAGLLAQLEFETNSKNTILVTDSKWKVCNDSSWYNTSSRISRFQLVINDRLDLRKKIAYWFEPDFIDTQWLNATPLMRTTGWPSPQNNATAISRTSPWLSLTPRDLPYLVEKKIQAVNLVKTSILKDVSDTKLLNELNEIKLDHSISTNIKKEFDSHLKKKSPINIIAQPDGVTVLLFDFGELINGTPILEIEGETGLNIDIMCAPFVVDAKFSYKIVDSEFLDKIILSGQKDSWEASYFKPTRFMAVAIRNNTKPVKIHYVGIHQLKYPFEMLGSMKSKDAVWIENYNQATAKTIHACTTDAMTDNYRERRQYAQTNYYGSLGNYYLFGDMALQRRCLLQVAQEQMANGIMPAYAPLSGDDYMVIFDSNCLWVRSLYNYYLYSGDAKTVTELLPTAKKMMQLFHSYTNQLGMIDNPPYAYWLDHTLNDRRGANLNLNGHYLGALDDFSKILNWLNDKDNVVYEKRAVQLRESIQKNLWDNDRKLFADALIDGKLSDVFSEHANAMALALKIATEEQANEIAKQLLVQDAHNYIFRKSGIVMVTPAMSYFLHKGLCEYGFIESSLSMFRSRFDKMLKEDTNQTLWEEWWLDAIGRSGKIQKGRTRSDAQTESAFPPALFAEYILGVKPLTPGMKIVEVKNHNSGVNNIEAKIPTPEGILEISWSKSEKTDSYLVLNVPGEMIVNLDINSLKSNKNIQLNNQVLKNGFSSIQLKKGINKITF